MKLLAGGKRHLVSFFRVKFGAFSSLAPNVLVAGLRMRPRQFTFAPVGAIIEVTFLNTCPLVRFLEELSVVLLDDRHHFANHHVSNACKHGDLLLTDDRHGVPPHTFDDSVVNLELVVGLLRHETLVPGLHVAHREQLKNQELVTGAFTA